jgi:hypothetical protein
MTLSTTIRTRLVGLNRRLVYTAAVLVVLVLWAGGLDGPAALPLSALSLVLAVLLLADTRRTIIEGRTYRTRIGAETARITTWTAALVAGEIGPWPDWQGRTEAEAEANTAAKVLDPALVAANAAALAQVEAAKTAALAQLEVVRAECKAREAAAINRLVDAQLRNILVKAASGPALD